MGCLRLADSWSPTTPSRGVGADTFTIHADGDNASGTLTQGDIQIHG